MTSKKPTKARHAIDIGNATSIPNKAFRDAKKELAKKGADVSMGIYGKRRKSDGFALFTAPMKVN